MRLPLSLSALLIICSTLGASAQTVLDARCLKMKDPVGCTCALAFGGEMTNGTWSPGRGADKKAIDECVAERGGKAKAKPPSMPGRLL
jgi:hypothetical protein